MPHPGPTAVIAQMSIAIGATDPSLSLERRSMIAPTGFIGKSIKWYPWSNMAATGRCLARLRVNHTFADEKVAIFSGAGVVRSPTRESSSSSNSSRLAAVRLNSVIANELVDLSTLSMRRQRFGVHPDLHSYFHLAPGVPWVRHNLHPSGDKPKTKKVPRTF